jgi:hypothetical protein
MDRQAMKATVNLSLPVTVTGVVMAIFWGCDTYTGVVISIFCLDISSILAEFDFSLLLNDGILCGFCHLVLQFLYLDTTNFIRTQT